MSACFFRGGAAAPSLLVFGPLSSSPRAAPPPASDTAARRSSLPSAIAASAALALVHALELCGARRSTPTSPARQRFSVSASRAASHALTSCDSLGACAIAFTAEHACIAVSDASSRSGEDSAVASASIAPAARAFSQVAICRTLQSACVPWTNTSADLWPWRERAKLIASVPDAATTASRCAREAPPDDRKLRATTITPSSSALSPTWTRSRETRASAPPAATTADRGPPWILRLCSARAAANAAARGASFQARISARLAGAPVAARMSR